MPPNPESQDQNSGPAWARASGVSLLVAAAIPLIQFALLFPMTLGIPSWDQWSEIGVFAAHYEHRPVLPLLLKPYNGHFNVLPRMIFFFLGLLTHWNVKVEVLASYAVCAGTVAALIAMLRETDSRLLVLAAPLSAYVFSIVQFENFLSGYSLTQNLSILASVLAVFLLTRRDPSRNLFWLALLSALVASFSFGGGNAIWVAGLFAIAIAGGRRAVRLAAWSAVGLGSLLLARVASRTAHLYVNRKTVVPFFFAVLGRPYVPIPNPSLQLAAAAGLGAVLIFSCCAAWALRGRDLRRDSLGRWLSLGLLALGSAGLIAMARSTAPPKQALAAHYAASTSLLGAATLVLFSMLLDRGLRRPSVRLLAVGLAASLSLAVSVVASARWLPVLRGYTVTRRRNAADLTAGTATDAQIRQSIYPRPEQVRKGLLVLRKYRLAMFREQAVAEPSPGAGPGK